MEKTELVEAIVQEEWTMFDKVRNVGGRAACQDDRETFQIMRSAQFEAWDEGSLRSYLEDVSRAKSEGRNLLTEKYAYMMEFTSPGEYRQIAARLPEISEEKSALIQEILAVTMRQTEEFMEQYPKFGANSRPVHEGENRTGVTSIETYGIGEWKTYSVKTLRLYYTHIKKLEGNGQSIVYRIYENTAKRHGYPDVSTAERSIGRVGE